MNDRFWWPLHDWVTYKVPVDEGAVLLPEDYIAPGFVPDVTELWFSFVHGRKDRRRVADFSCLAGGCVFFVNERAHRVFADLFARHGRSYRVRCGDEPYYMVLIDTRHDAVDLARSKFERSGLEERLEDDISRVLRITLKVGFKTDDDIFRPDGAFALSTSIIVSDRFKQRYEQAGLTGFFYKATNGGR